LPFDAAAVPTFNLNPIARPSLHGRRVPASGLRWLAGSRDVEGATALADRASRGFPQNSLPSGHRADGLSRSCDRYRL